MAKEAELVSTDHCEALRGAFSVEFKHIQEDLEENKVDNKLIKKDLTYLRSKIDNGFGAEIHNTNSRIDDLKKENATGHKQTDDDVRGIRKLLIWFMVMGGLGALGLIFDIVTQLTTK
ncbi:hypothetical protein KAR91_82515 [Candidatus Pacearchaeota archaeon]|nr:hypothetical protein [Candidatus Pacearchaeota archaeon]